MAPRPALHRLKKRPHAVDWDEDELISLAEAEALFFSRGPFNAIALRSAATRGELCATTVCGRLYTTPAAVRAFTRVRPADERGQP